MTAAQTTITGWKFDNSYTDLPEMFYSRIGHSAVPSPELVVVNHSLAGSLGLNLEALHADEWAGMLSAAVFPEGADPLAQAYAGHQFGHFTMLGDGRALLLGEQITPKGKRFDIQLKGSGRTPYSRGGDGKAVLGPMLREYIISEAMHALGIPTTRSLAVVTTGEKVFRQGYETGAILTRTASSHLRVGTFQYAAQWGSGEDVRILADYVLQRHFPVNDSVGNRYLFLLKEVVRRQAELIAKWQLAGFIHGVMNTDNMSICGETIDYGPCAFLDTYDEATVFSSIDNSGRYAFGNQPHMAVWNLARFAETLLPLISDNEEKAVEAAQNVLEGFYLIYREQWLAGMRAKLGLFNEEHGDAELIQDLLSLMETNKADYTNTFLALTFNRPDEIAMSGISEFDAWYENWRARLSGQEESESSSFDLMKRSNPALIPRNHRVEEALKAAEKGDYNVMNRFLDALSRPYKHSAEQEEYFKPPEPSNTPYRTFCGT